MERSEVFYDQYGRQMRRIDYTNHGYGNRNDPKNYHSTPHTHLYEYGPGTVGGRNIMINHDWVFKYINIGEYDELGNIE